ncbi:MAG: acyl-CoA synthetase [Planctomycetales bacterium]|nr:acyl-CoA synthetase [Planctomycetales bacterium]
MKHLRLIQRAIEHGDRIALSTDREQYTYNEVVDRSSQIAAAILDSAPTPSDDLAESRVAYLVPAGFDYVATQWGIWRAGGIALPLSLSATEKELEYALAACDSCMVLSTDELAPRLSGLAQRIGINHLVIDPIAESSRDQLPTIDPDRAAMILYTSGTTSKPKGVVTTHACIEQQIKSLIQAWHWNADDCIPLFLPMHHIHGIINIMSCALWAGAKIEVHPRFDVDAIFKRVSEDAYTVFMAVPTIYVKMIETLESISPSERDSVIGGFSKMRLMVSGSAALPVSVHRQWTDLTGQKLLERYGMTEIGMALSNPYQGQRRPGSVGLPLPGVEIRLYGDDGQTIQSEDVAGEIQVRGANVFREYYGRAEATKESFIDGWFRTGDVAVLEKGYYRILGRTSIDIIKSGGYKLSALEIEATLLDHPAICQCAVVGVADETWGECVAAAIVLQKNQTVELDDLRSWCKERISAYKIPRRMLIVDDLPRNAMGKVTKPDVTKLFQ